MSKSYRDTIMLKIRSNSYMEASSLNMIIDNVHQCGWTGHSFNIVAVPFGGAVATDDSHRLGGADEIRQQMFNKIDDDAYEITLIGTRCGIETIQNMVELIIAHQKEINDSFKVCGRYKSDGKFGSFGWEDEPYTISVDQYEISDLEVDINGLLFYRKAAR